MFEPVNVDGGRSHWLEKVLDPVAEPVNVYTTPPGANGHHLVHAVAREVAEGQGR